MKICAMCLTHNRPQLVAEAVRMFELQTYRDCEMVVLDNCGQYESGRFGNVTVRSEKLNVKSIGALRNMAAELTDADAIALWDDDDHYYPWHLEAVAAALDKHVWACPSRVWDYWDANGPILTEPFNRRNRRGLCYHGTWAYRVEAFLSAGRYPEDKPGDQDCVLGARLFDRYGPPADTISERFPVSSYLYTRDMSKCWHSSEMRPDAVLAQFADNPGYVGRIVPRWPEHFLRGLPIGAHVVPRKW